MTESTTSPINNPVDTLANGAWGWVLLRGILAIVFGVIALISPVAAIEAIAIVFGAYALVDGVVGIVHSIRVRHELPRWGWVLVQGILSAIAGLAALILPGIVGAFGALIVLWIIVIWNVTQGAATIRSAAGAQSKAPKGWAIAGGVVSILFGILLGILTLVIPGATLLGLVWVTGVYAIVFGVMLAVAALQARASGAAASFEA